MQESYGCYGKQGDSFASARKDYPEKAYKMVCTGLHQGEHVIDLGCGTGISTRGMLAFMKQTVTLRGVDNDHKMLYRARQVPNPKIAYRYGSVHECIPAPDRGANLITAWGSFHWFLWRRLPEEIDRLFREIHRVAKPGARLCIVNKQDLSPLARIAREIVGGVAGYRPVGVKETYQPLDLLRSRPYTDSSGQYFHAKEVFASQKEVLQFFKSMGVYRQIPPGKHKYAQDQFKNRTESLFRAGVFERELRISVVSGYIPNISRH